MNLNKGHIFWDQTLLQDLDVSATLVPGALNSVGELPEGTIVITSDEENKFPIEAVSNKIFVQYPTERHKLVDGFVPTGYPPKCRELVKKNGMSAKSLDWFFAGQKGNREDCLKQLRDLEGGKLVETEGFAQGLEYEEYMQCMCRAKVIPCPGGPHTPDTFRLYEALEAGCIPIVENKRFWELLFGEVPFPIVNDWSELPGLIQHYKDRQDVANKCSAWWQTYKRKLAWTLR